MKYSNNNVVKIFILQLVIRSVIGQVERPLTYDGHCTDAPLTFALILFHFPPSSIAFYVSHCLFCISLGFVFLFATLASICFWFNSILVHCTFCAGDDAGSAAEGDECVGRRGGDFTVEVRYFPFLVRLSWFCRFCSWHCASQQFFLLLERVSVASLLISFWHISCLIHFHCWTLLGGWNISESLFANLNRKSCG